MRTETERARRALRLGHWLIDQLERDDAPEHDLEDILSACLMHIVGMGRHSGETIERLTQRAELALEIARAA